jgi:tRNA threonylcarbamoyladenosine biosynthesis protein TsaE
MKLEYTTNSPEETLALGSRIGSLLSGGEIILLSGELGAGKTLLTRGIVQGMGPDSETKVVSPSFTLVNIYNARLDIIHVDLYRLDSEEIAHLGLEDYMDRDHVLIVEWAERAGGFFQGPTVDIAISHAGEYSRNILISTDFPGIEALSR